MDSTRKILSLFVALAFALGGLLTTRSLWRRPVQSVSLSSATSQCDTDREVDLGDFPTALDAERAALSAIVAQADIRQTQCSKTRANFRANYSVFVNGTRTKSSLEYAPWADIIFLSSAGLTEWHDVKPSAAHEIVASQEGTDGLRKRGFKSYYGHRID